MKITQLVPALTKGGAERVLVELANRAQASGHEVTVLAAYPVDPELMRNRLDPAVEVRYISGARQPLLRRYFSFLPWLWRNRQWMSKQDIVHCHLTFAAVAGTLIKCWRQLSGRRRPGIIETFHSVGMPLPKWKRTSMSFLAAGRDGYALVAEDEYWSRFRQRHPHLPVDVIANGITFDLPRLSESETKAYRRLSGIPDDARFVVGTVGRIIRDRAPLFVVGAFARISRVLGPEVHFFMGGEGPMLDDVLAEAERFGIKDRLHLPGLIADPPSVFSMLDLYVTINVGLITGVAGLEAGAFGLPVIAVNTRPDHNGELDWIWSSPDPDQVGDRAAALLTDPEQRRRLAEFQQRHVYAHHSSQAMQEAYEALYSRALARDDAVS